MKFNFSIIVTSIGAAFGFLYGKIDTLFYIMICMTVIDYMSGIAKAIYKKELSSYIGAKGIVKKVLIYMVIAVAHLIDRTIGLDCVMNAALFFYIANEGLSILENLVECEVPIPQIVVDALDQIGKKSEKEAEK